MLSSEAPQPLLLVRNLSVAFGAGTGVEPVTRGVSFALDQGQTLAIVGESGSGKSATALTIPRLLSGASIRSGEIHWRGARLDLMSDRELRAVRGKEIGVVFQEPMTSLNPVMSVGAQIVEALRVHVTLSSREAKDRAIGALARVGIEDPAGCFAQFPHQLSGGMRQRVMIAIALICDPRMLIADEPTTALDVTVQKRVLEIIRSLRDERGMAVLLVTHDMGVVAEQADAVCVMCEGRVLEFGPAHAVLSRPLHPYTLGLLRSAPRLGERAARLTTVADVMADPGVQREFVAVSGGLRPYWPGTGEPAQSWRLAELGPSRWGAAWGNGESRTIVPWVARESRRVSV